jgi:hypothetical protein
MTSQKLTDVEKAHVTHLAERIAHAQANVQYQQKILADLNLNMSSTLQLMAKQKELMKEGDDPIGLKVTQDADTSLVLSYEPPPVPAEAA